MMGRNFVRQSWALLQEKARVPFLALAALVCFGGLVELAGISATADLMGLVATGGKNLSVGPSSLLFRYTEQTDPHTRLQLALVITLLILALVHGYSMLRAYLRTRFVWIQEKEISSRIFRAAINRPYSWYLERNSAELQRLMASSHITQRLLGSILSAMGSGSVAFTLLLALVVADPKVALVGTIFVCLAYILVIRYTKTTLHKKGSQANEAAAAARLISQEALTSIRFVKTTAREEFFAKEFESHIETASKGMVYHGIYVEVVRAFLEWITFAGILSLSVYLVIQSQDIAALLPRLALYTMAGYRVVPAVHLLFNLSTRIKFDAAFLGQVLEIMNYPIPSELETGEEIQGLDKCENLVTFKDVNFRYTTSERPIIKDLSFELKKGQWVGIVGTTGAGKTTLLDLMSGLITTNEGDIYVAESILNQDVLRDWQTKLGVVPQEVILLDDSISRNVAFGLPSEKIDLDFVEKCCQLAGLQPLLERLPEKLETRLGERGTRLSGGERQRVGLARALYRKPTLLLLDEATSALDQATEAKIIETLKNLSQDCTLVTVAHRLSSVAPCDKILVLEEGQIVGQGKFDQLLDSNPTFQKLALHRG